MSIMCYSGREPDIKGGAGEAWEWKHETKTCLGAWLLHRPDAHPFWHNYIVSVVHLRDEDGMSKARKLTPDASHELLVYALDPNAPPDPDDIDTLRILTPPNMMYQMEHFDDATALKLAEDLVRQFTIDLNPDTDHRGCQVEWLKEWSQTRSDVQ